MYVVDRNHEKSRLREYVESESTTYASTRSNSGFHAARATSLSIAEHRSVWLSGSDVRASVFSSGGCGFRAPTCPCNYLRHLANRYLRQVPAALSIGSHHSMSGRTNVNINCLAVVVSVYRCVSISATVKRHYARALVRNVKCIQTPRRDQRIVDSEVNSTQTNEQVLQNILTNGKTKVFFFFFFCFFVVCCF